MHVVMLFGALAIGLPFIIGGLAEGYGPTMASRFLERGEPYSVTTLVAFVVQQANEAHRYAMPILVPLDLVYAVSAGLFLALGSRWCASAIDPLRLRAAWFMILPLLFAAFDVSEDASLARMLLSPDAVTDRSVAFTQFLTSAKILLMKMSLCQAVVLGAWAGYLDLRKRS